jgi:hypothetical protein
MIADTLKVSKQLVSNWLSGYRTVSLDEWTQIQAVINRESGGAQFPEENKPMNSINEPKTLFQAKEQLHDLRLEVAQLKAAAATSAPATPTPAAKPALPAAAATPTPTAMECEIQRAYEARTAGLSDKPLPEQSIDELRAALNVAEPEDQAAIYSELKSRQGDGAMRAYRTRRR